MVVKLWYALKDCAINAISHPGAPFAYNGCQFTVLKDRTGRPWLQLLLPSGRALYYCEPEIREDKYGMVPTSMGIDSYTYQWKRKKLTPGLLTENTVQAICRDILAEAVHRLIKKYMDVVFHVHDEIVVMIPEEYTEQDLKHNIINVMCEPPWWADKFPIAAEGEMIKRYQKI